jgi:hypothetical protein
MTQKKQKRKELHQLNDFRALLPDFPEGKLEISERPDFVIQSANGSVGVEVTSIFHEASDPRRSIQAQESECRQMLDEACRMYDQMKLPPLNVSVLFKAPTALNRRNRSHFARTLADLVAKNVPSSKGFYSLEIDSDSTDRFPLNILSIHMVRFDFPKSSFISMPIDLTIKEEFSAELQKVISGKDELLSKYQKCDVYWLLVVAEWAAPSSFFDPSKTTLSTLYHSSFDRVFFLNMFDHVPVELSLANRAP